MQCITCDKETSNPKFCSRSCAATHNNSRAPKRKLEGTCARCSGVCTRERTYCRTCWLEIRAERSKLFTSNTTLGELKGLGSANGGGRYPYIRRLSRNSYIKSGRPMECRKCGYDVHVDICHIKEVKSFPLTATIAEVNDPSNLVALCKNHHWELDNGHLFL